MKLRLGDDSLHCLFMYFGKWPFCQNIFREECVSLSFQCQFVALNNNDHGMANWFNQRPNGKDWIVSLNGQHLFTTGEYNHCSEHFWSWMLAVFSHCLVRVLSEFISFCGRKLSLQPQVLQIYTKSLWGFTVCLSCSIAGKVSNR